MRRRRAARGSPGPSGRLVALLVAVAVAVGALGGCGGPGAGPPGADAAGLPAGEDARVAEVVDGDTIVVGPDRSVRLIGVDTPETRHPDRGVECFGKEATRYTERLLPRGTRVRLVADVERRDRYDRTLAYVYRSADGLFVNAALARDGYARPLTIPPNVAHAGDLASLADRAREQGRGLWGACR